MFLVKHKDNVAPMKNDTMTRFVWFMLCAFLSVGAFFGLPPSTLAGINPPPGKPAGPSESGKDEEDKTCDEDPESMCKPCKENDSSESGNECLSFKQTFGQSPWIAGSGKGALMVYETKISYPFQSGKSIPIPGSGGTIDPWTYANTLVSWVTGLGRPAMFRYDHVLARRVVNLDLGLNEITIEDALGRQTVYRDGKPVQLASGRNRQCRLMPDGKVVEFLADRTKIFYGPDNDVFKVVTPAGVEAAREDFGIRIIRDKGNIRQVWSKADGLLDVTEIDETEVRVSWYAPSAVSSAPGPSGVYTFTAPPFKTFTFSEFAQVIIEAIASGGPSGGPAPVQFVISGVDAIGLRLAEGFPEAQRSFSCSWLYDCHDQNWTFEKGPVGMFKDQVDKTHSVETDLTTITKRVESASGVPLLMKEVYRNDLTGARLLERSVAGTNGASTVLFSAQRVSQGENAGRPLSVTDGRGNTKEYAYDTDGRVTQKVETVCGSLPQVTRHEYAPADADGFIDRRPRRTVVACAGVVVSDTLYSYGSPWPSGGSVDSVTRRDPVSGVELTSLRLFYDPSGTAPGIARGRLAAAVGPDGSATSYVYESVEGGGWTETATTGYWDAEGSPAAGGGSFHIVPGRSSRTVGTYDFRGDLVWRDRFVHTGDDFALAEWESYAYDPLHQETHTETSDGRIATAAWIDSVLLRRENADGTSVTNTLDAVKRLATSTRRSPFGAVTTAYTYDVSDRETSRAVSTNGAVCQTEAREYDHQGRIVRAVDAAGGVTVTEYSPDNRTVTVTDPAGGVTVTARHSDGSLLSVTGSAVIPRFYTYGVNLTDGTRWTRMAHGSPDSPAYETQVFNALGQLVRSEKPGFGGAALQTVYLYNELGQLVAKDASGQPLREYAYAFGSASGGGGCSSCGSGGGAPGARVAVTETADGVSRTRFSFSGFTEGSDGSVWEVETGILSASDPALPALTNTVARRLFPLDPGLASETVETDPRGNATLMQSSFDRDTCTRVTAVTAPFAALPAVTVETDGLTVMTVSHSAVTNRYAYDALRRRTAATDGRGNTNRIHYAASGFVDCTEDASGARTLYEYDAKGRRTAVTDALSNTVCTAYDGRGNITAQWGATYPVSYEYDAQGRMVQMGTYRGAAEITDYAVFQSLVSSFDKTVWLYDQPTGLLTNKVYADGLGPSYTYTPDGKLLSRVWARGVATVYAYDGFNRPVAVDYSDGTPDIGFAYDAFDRLTEARTVSPATGEVLTVTTNIYSGLDLVSETQNGSIITRFTDVFGRPAGLSPGGDCEVFYGYDDFGRFFSVSSSVCSVSSVVDYFRLPGTDIISGYTAGPLAVTKTFEPHRDLITQVRNETSAGVISQYDYSNDAIGNRVSRHDSGLAFAQAQTNLFGYNPRSEVTGAVMHTNAYGYAYDPIGNRLLSSHNAETNTYIANALNQYSQISVSSVQSVDNLLPLHDADGNMTFDGKEWFYVWNGENRLILASNAQHVVTYAYDHRGRMVWKTVSSSAAPPAKAIAYIWDDYNILRETISNHQSTITNSYVWGLDLSGTLQGAGGVGGLLAVHKDGAFFFPVYDANGNIIEYIAPDGVIAAHREYSAFGETIIISGTFADSFTHWWSTKPWCSVCNQIEYEFRKYNPSTGGWLSRDPIGDRGGLNLYGFVGNEPLNKTDYLGRMSMPWGLSCCNGKPYDEKASCCINGTIVSRDEQISVKICRRKANIWGGNLCAALGSYHEFVVGPDGPPVGLGPRGTKGNPGYNWPLTPTALTDHTGEVQNDCRTAMVSRCQFFEKTRVGTPQGPWIPLCNDCNTTVDDILESWPGSWLW
jgi:RHS repeat-associated protein